MELARVEDVEEGLQLARMIQRVCEFDGVGDRKVDILVLVEEHPLNEVGVLLYVVVHPGEIGHGAGVEVLAKDEGGRGVVGVKEVDLSLSDLNCHARKLRSRKSSTWPRFSGCSSRRPARACGL